MIYDGFDFTIVSSTCWIVMSIEGELSDLLQ